MIRIASKAQAETPIPIPVFAAVERRELPTLLEEEVDAIIQSARCVIWSEICRYRMFERAMKMEGWRYVLRGRYRVTGSGLGNVRD